MSRKLTPILTLLAVPVLATFAFLAAPDAPGTPAALDAAQAAPQGAALARTLEAHGGLDRWRQQRIFSYTLNGFPLSSQVAKPNHSTVDLWGRRNRIVGAAFTVGFDGQQAWGTPTEDAAGLPARFFTLGSFYFIGMPFVFADPGVRVEEQGLATFRGGQYRVVRVTFARGVGYTPDDDYILYIDRETHLLRLIHHAVTEPGKEIERVTWVFDEWQEVAGLKVPKRMTFYPGWNGGKDPENSGKDPEKGASFTVEGASFSREAPDAEIYRRPAGR